MWCIYKKEWSYDKFRETKAIRYNAKLEPQTEKTYNILYTYLRKYIPFVASKFKLYIWYNIIW